ncbi:MAG TPA: ATP-binding cassette domain-containing protein [Phenylobacterium sp.]
MAALRLESVVKRFGDFTAVDELSFQAPEGKVFGFLGANGAGKTTTLRMVLDILRPTSGTIELLGRRPGPEVANELGFLPEERGLYRKMTPLETVSYFGQLKGMTKSDATRVGQQLIERYGLGAWARQTVDKLSKGMAQKVQLAAAVVNSPKLLILDEPFSGLDPVNQAVLEDSILEFAKAGSTVIFSTHVMQHAERLSDRLLLLSRGRKVFEGTPDQAKAKLPSRLTLASQQDPSGLAGVKTARSGEADKEGFCEWELELKRGADPADILQACIAAGFTLRRFETRKASLHEVFLHLVGDPVEEAA